MLKEDAEELLSRCNKVLKDHSKAEKLLPTMSGFFFGNTDYNSHYYDDVLTVRDFIKDKLLPQFDHLNEDEAIDFDISY